MAEEDGTGAAQVSPLAPQKSRLPLASQTHAEQQSDRDPKSMKSREVHTIRARTEA